MVVIVLVGVAAPSLYFRSSTIIDKGLYRGGGSVLTTTIHKVYRSVAGVNLAKILLSELSCYEMTNLWVFEAFVTITMLCRLLLTAAGDRFQS